MEESASGRWSDVTDVAINAGLSKNGVRALVMTIWSMIEEPWWVRNNRTCAYMSF